MDSNEYKQEQAERLGLLPKETSMELGTELKYYQQQILDRIKQEYPFHRPSNLRPYEPDTNHYLQQLTLTDAEYKGIDARITDLP